METTPARRAVRWLVAGRVQGVGFRYFVREVARDLGVTGRVRNLPGGEVEIEAAGDPAALDRLRERVRRGPPGARVAHLSEQELSAVPGWDRFEIDR
jgi:acylphosphatase